METLRRLALRIRLNKVDGVGITGPVLLHELLPESRIVQGWCRINGKNPCWHVVVFNGDECLDIGHEMACMQDPDFRKHSVTFTTEEPEEGVESDKMVLDTWEIYQANPGNFWKMAPKKIQDFRSKMKRLHSEGKL